MPGQKEDRRERTTEMKERGTFHAYRMRYGRLTAILLAVCLVLLPQSAVYATQNAGGTASVSEPEIQAQGAVVIDAATGQILYGKNANTKYYPASITKLMTALLVIENCDLNGTVTFSKTATTNLEAGAVSLGMVEGDQLTVRQCLYALLLKSANEVGNALAEHVSGSISAFADLMNKKAAALGCTNTHFVNPHGLNDPNHYTTPYDMALIGRAAFANSTLREIDTTLSYKLPATKKNEAMTITMGHKMLYPDDSRYYEGIIGGKTGFTSLAGNTLVTGAERNGVRLIAVVMKANGTHYTDTKALLDYGFAKMTAGASGPLGSAPVQTGPQTQQTQAPASPETQMQVTSETQASGSPEAQTPASPETQAPSTPESQAPGSLEFQAPASPVTQEAPASPETQVPSTPETQAPASPAAQEAPASPETQAPSTPETQAPASPATQEAPASPETQAPSIPETQAPTSPAAQEAPAIQQTETAAAAAKTAGWGQDAAGWYYIKSDGRRAAGEWLNLDGTEYWIDANGYMATGWRLFVNGDWYYFRSSGVMAKNYWVQDNGKWFYLGGNGTMLKGTVTPDGYTLGADGAWMGN